MSRKGPLGAAATWTLGARLATLSCAFAANAALARLLSQSELGTYFAFAALVPLAAVVTQMGLDKTVVMHGTAALSRHDVRRAKTEVGSRIVAALLLASIFAPVLAVVAWLGAELFVSIPVSVLVAGGVGLWAVANGLRNISAESFRAFHRFGVASFYSGTFDALALSTALLIMVALRGSLSLGLAVAFSAAAVGIGACIALIHVRQISIWAFDLHETLAVLRQSFSITGAGLSLFVLGSGIDVLLLSAVRSDSDVASYGAAARLATVIVIVHGMMTAAIPSLYVHLMSRRRQSELESLLRVAASVAAVPSLAILAVYLPAGQFVLGTVFGPDYRSAYPILIALSLGHLSTVVTGPSALALTLSGDAAVVMRSTIAVGIVATVVGVAAATAWGGLALAAVTAVGVGVQNVWLFYQARSRLGLLTAPTVSLGDFRVALRPSLLSQA